MIKITEAARSNGGVAIQARNEFDDILFEILTGSEKGTSVTCNATLSPAEMAEFSRQIIANS